MADWAGHFVHRARREAGRVAVAVGFVKAGERNSVAIAIIRMDFVFIVFLVVGVKCSKFIGLIPA